MRITRSEGPAGHVGYVEGTIPPALHDRVAASGLDERDIQHAIEAALAAACDFKAWTAGVAAGREV